MNREQTRELDAQTSISELLDEPICAKCLQLSLYPASPR